jgi:8-oxo-dGTP pyrophosphatase MutT (NUDIX family)
MSFPVSIKGVLLEAGHVVLVENERSEWELPGGRLQAGEDDPAICLAREFAEELGIKVAVKTILDSWVYEVLPGQHVVIVTYGAERVDQTPLRLSHEHRRLGSFSITEIDGLVTPEGYRRSIRAWAAMAGTAEPAWLGLARELQALSQTGLFYSNDKYDTERYERLRVLATDMMAMGAGVASEEIIDLFRQDTGYATPRVDVRGPAMRRPGSMSGARLFAMGAY